MLALPVLLYSASDYLKSAVQGIRQKRINIDVPISLGVVVLFGRSAYEIISNTGAGYMDSLAGLIFFLLLGKVFQQITYNTLSFERDYKSYFPVAITKLSAGSEEAVSLNDVEVGDILLVKNEEIIPVDAELVEGTASIDNSFVTGESKVATKHPGDKIYAGGKQVGGAIKVKVLKKLSQSYLTQLWNNEAFETNAVDQFENLTNSISKYFTIVILTIAFISGGYWLQHDFKTALNAFTAVLIIACPCALALAAPFTYGNVLRVLGRNKFFLKNANVIERLAAANTMVFDKTGTLTQSSKSDVVHHGKQFTNDQLGAFYSLLRQSSHPLSIILFNQFKKQALQQVTNYKEVPGAGIMAVIEGNLYKLGSKQFVTGNESKETKNFATEVYFSQDDKLICHYTISNNYRKGLKKCIKSIRNQFKLSVLTGDNEGEKERLANYFEPSDTLIFNQSPEDKLNYIKSLQNGGYKVVMIGDGLNDSGALKKSDVGISISEDVNTFSPACDAILDADAFDQLPRFIKYSKLSIRIVIASFIISFAYNSVGLYFSVIGLLSPVIAAILMPLSSITVVLFVTIASSLVAMKHKLL